MVGYFNSTLCLGAYLYGKDFLIIGKFNNFTPYGFDEYVQSLQGRLNHWETPSEFPIEWITGANAGRNAVGMLSYLLILIRFKD